ncbi:MAG: hypothetical protein F9K16_00025 [Thermoanaerobaculia bacterium]|nr:MAG: hypothetical protein F9K16_00025 [Thermoanaerobaculia bacterium]MBZ0103460.1 hypothetical protein [Thermoanaerobaculia bacterium]
MSREQLHQLVDTLPDSEVDTATRVLAALGRSASTALDRALAAVPVEDEELSPGELADLAESLAEPSDAPRSTSAGLRRERDLA